MPTSTTQDIAATLEPCIGHTLVRVFALVFCLDGDAQDDEPDQIELVFSNQKTSGKILCSSDGETLALDLSEMTAVDMQEAGRLAVRDFTHRPPWNACLGKKLEGVTFLVGSRSNKALGIQFNFCQNATASLINQGDELRCHHEFPPVFVEEENARLITAPPKTPV